MSLGGSAQRLVSQPLQVEDCRADGRENVVFHRKFLEYYTGHGVYLLFLDLANTGNGSHV